MEGVEKWWNITKELPTIEAHLRSFLVSKTDILSQNAII